MHTPAPAVETKSGQLLGKHKEKKMEKNTEENEKKMVRCTFELTEEEAAKLCDMRCEPKVSTAAAQVVRIAIREG